MALTSQVHLTKTIKIADTTFRLNSELLMDISEGFSDFVIDDYKGVVNGVGYFYPIQSINVVQGTKIGQSYDHYIVQDDEGNVLTYYLDEIKNIVYAFSREDNTTGNIQVYYLPTYANWMQHIYQYFHLLGWEKILMKNDRFLLHASCIQTEYGGLLFSGPSGIGKSSQADLWIRYRGAQLINGDRPVIGKKDVWNAYGSPFAGSSKVHIDKCVPIKAVFILRQSTENSLKRMSKLDAFRNIFSGATVYTWDEAFVSKVVSLVEKLIQEVPVYELACNLTENAVEVVEQELNRGLV